jgi:ribonuclease P protein component
MEVNQRFPRTESLKQKRVFDALFKGANKSFQHPVMALWKRIPLPENVPAQIGLSVPKKHFKKAVDRNTIKRRLREAYRLNKHIIHAPLLERKEQIAVVFIVLKTDNTSYDILGPKMMLLLRDIASKIKHD